MGKLYNFKSEISEFSKKYFDFNNNWHHELFYLILENKVIQKDGRFYPNKKKKKKNKNILVVVPRFHAKSTVFSFIYPLYEITRNPNIRILVVSANEDIASSFVRQTMTALQNNEKLIEDFGYLQPKINKTKWGERAFIVKRKTIEKDPTMSAAGLNGRIVSKRADIIIVDDLIDLERARTEKQRKKTLEWFDNVLYPILAPEGRLIVVGTRWHKEDFYHSIMETKHFDINLTLKALIYSSAHLKRGDTVLFRGNFPYNPYKEERLAQDIRGLFTRELVYHLGLREKLKHGVLWYPEWSYEKLLEKRKVMGEASFSCQYLNEPISEEDAFFNKKWIDEAYDKGKTIHIPQSWDNMNFGYFPHKQMLVVMGVDLAISVKKQSDFNAIAVWGLDSDGIRWLLHIDKFKAPPQETKQRIIDKYRTFNPIVCVVETNAFQDLIRQELAEDINVIGEKTTSLNKMDEVVGLAHISTLFENGKIIIPNAGKNNFQVMSFYQDLVSFIRSDHTPDTVMASWLALKKIKEYAESVKGQGGYLSQFAIETQVSNLTAPHKIQLSYSGEPFFATTSVVSVFIPKSAMFLRNPSQIMDYVKSRKMYGIATQKGGFLAYFFDIETKELLVKIDGNISLSFFIDLLYLWLTNLGNPRLTIYEAEPLLYGLIKKNYQNIFTSFSDREGKYTLKKSITHKDIVLSAHIDRARYLIEKGVVLVKDANTFREFNRITDVNGDDVITIDGVYPARAVTFSLGISLLDNIREENPKKKKKRKLILPPYKIFNYKI
jgi:phage terminase large subunit-like protein